MLPWKADFTFFYPEDIFSRSLSIDLKRVEAAGLTYFTRSLNFCIRICVLLEKSWLSQR